ncbi:hypothetical protein GQR58_022300 [Nymphon striatum]|nr:hypothetical protein GQR58_022300 [Nymphon striatum]
MLKVKYTDHVTSKKVKELIGAENIQWAEDLSGRKLKFAGHVMRGCCDTLTQLVLEGLVEGKRDKGNKNLGEVKRQAENKVVWRNMVHDLRFEDQSPTDKNYSYIHKNSQLVDVGVQVKPDVKTKCKYAARQVIQCTALFYNKLSDNVTMFGMDEKCMEEIDADDFIQIQTKKTNVQYQMSNWSQYALSFCYFDTFKIRLCTSMGRNLEG